MRRRWEGFSKSIEGKKVGMEVFELRGETHTRSARLSNSCPMRLDLCLHRATLPSMKSKNRPKGMNAKAA